MKSLFILPLTLLLSVVCNVQATEVVYWDKLRPTMTLEDDPFLTLDQNQLFDLATIARFNEAAQQEDFSASQEALDEIKQTKQRLAKQGVDVEYLFEMREIIRQQREELATKPNAAVLNKMSRIPGFITPVEFNGTKVTKFFLVPTAGACIHTPPPPPNQIVLIDYPSGIELVSLATPVWVEGKLINQSVTANVDYSDGSTGVEAVYSMQAEEIELYQN
ncbi:DUF3299 domain-containing protein [Vibrio sp. TBV020]|uniref:DUF3299 domain-containing protein n=1 Tax=Vibrio sp. TBV020 TaxID=3137398 RepID=UPI0038CDB620